MIRLYFYAYLNKFTITFILMCYIMYSLIILLSYRDYFFITNQVVFKTEMQIAFYMNFNVLYLISLFSTAIILLGYHTKIDPIIKPIKNSSIIYLSKSFCLFIICGLNFWTLITLFYIIPSIVLKYFYFDKFVFRHFLMFLTNVFLLITLNSIVVKWTKNYAVIFVLLVLVILMIILPEHNYWYYFPFFQHSNYDYIDILYKYSYLSLIYAIALIINSY